MDNFWWFWTNFTKIDFFLNSKNFWKKIFSSKNNFFFYTSKTIWEYFGDTLNVFFHFASLRINFFCHREAYFCKNLQGELNLAQKWHFQKEKMQFLTLSANVCPRVLENTFLSPGIDRTHPNFNIHAKSYSGKWRV